MRRVIVTVGPQGAGKSTFCERAIEANSHLALISRDAILIEMYGSVWQDPYTGAHHYALEEMWRRVRSVLERETVTLLLDCWNDEVKRQEIPRKLKGEMRVDRVEAWYFVTPPDVCCRWFYTREPRNYANLTPEQVRKEQAWDRKLYLARYEDYHRYPPTIPPFDAVRSIDPCVDDPHVWVI